MAHSLIKKINRLRKTDSELAGLLARSLLDYLMIVGAVPFDVNSSCKRSLKLIERTADVRLGDKTGEEAKKPEGGNRFERPGQHRKQSVMREAHDAVKGVDHRKPVQEFVINAKGEPVPVNKKSDK